MANFAGSDTTNFGGETPSGTEANAFGYLKYTPRKFK